MLIFWMADPGLLCTERYLLIVSEGSVCKFSSVLPSLLLDCLLQAMEWDRRETVDDISDGWKRFGWDNLHYLCLRLSVSSKLQVTAINTSENGGLRGCYGLLTILDSHCQESSSYHWSHGSLWLFHALWQSSAASTYAALRMSVALMSSLSSEIKIEN